LGQKPTAVQLRRPSASCRKADLSSGCRLNFDSTRPFSSSRDSSGGRKPRSVPRELTALESVALLQNDRPTGSHGELDPPRFLCWLDRRSSSRRLHIEQQRVFLDQIGGELKGAPSVSCYALVKVPPLAASQAKCRSSSSDSLSSCTNLVATSLRCFSLGSIIGTNWDGS
jgi:hypothetical protein